MPFEQRVISPVGVGRRCVPIDSRGNLAVQVPNELECVTNGTLANIIRQLASLSAFAEDLFGAVLLDASQLVSRANVLQSRIDRLAVKVTSLDSSVEEVSLQDIHLRKAFRSSYVFDQQVVARETIPESIRQVYRHCDRPPLLSKLNAYRDDGKDGLKFYTDPNYFFDLWRQEMLADTERALQDRRRVVQKTRHSDQKKTRKVRPPNNTRERQRQMMANAGEFILDEPEDVSSGRRPDSLEIQIPFPMNSISNEVLKMNIKNVSNIPENDCLLKEQTLQLQGQQTTQRRLTSASLAPMTRPSQPPPAPPSQPNSQPNSQPATPSHGVVVPNDVQRTRNQRDALPPPPPPPVQEVNGEAPNVDPPPPPPPPPNSSPSDQQKANQFLSDLKSIQLKKTSIVLKPKETDPRSDLLAAIREGIQLKRVQDVQRREVERATPLHDVASILARRVAIELSDSEAEAEEADEEDDAWDDESEC
ncbi:actin-binding protein WASF3-like [Oppia nitens]|uniref:actin-binding protein WASF3-like n=1 Tax=Oppia nitens TaxID=1686743 RepID=UPI0023D99126|nr:actin-binding protein WASF3-like [Oppia nitens]